jgi:class 3 adenylate cyclase
VPLDRAHAISHNAQSHAAGVVDVRGRSDWPQYAIALMFEAPHARMLATMSELRADTPQVDWSDVGVSELPTGTVTLLLADVEGSTLLW